MKKTLPIIIAVAIVFAAGGFFGGMKYQQSKKVVAFNQAGQRAGGQVNFNRARGAGATGTFINGEILSKSDNNSLTIKARDNSSKIVFLSAKSAITKSASGTAEDLIVGQQVVVTGTSNADGTLTASTVSINPVRPQGIPGQSGAQNGATSTIPTK